MTTEENKKLILDHYESFVHQQDAEAVRRQLAADFRDHEMPPGTPPGPEAALQYRAMLHKAFPDLRVKIEDIIAEGDRVAVRASWTGAHRGLLPIMPVPVTNRAFAFTGMVF
jgi:predicted ester cyclase